MFTRFALSLESALAAYRDCRSARSRARNTRRHRELSALEEALTARIRSLGGSL